VCTATGDHATQSEAHHFCAAPQIGRESDHRRAGANREYLALVAELRDDLGEWTVAAFV
jgi:hypothetical protein